MRAEAIFRFAVLTLAWAPLFAPACGSDDDRAGVGGAMGGSAGASDSGFGGAAGSTGGAAGAAGAAGGETTILYPELTLSAAGASFANRDGTVYRPRQAISCCGGGYGWPLVDHAWVDYVALRSSDWLHVRLGPWRAVTGGEVDWQSVGGAYAEVGGKADLTQWNAGFWAAVEELLDYAGKKGMRVEVDVIDGWALKHAQADDLGPNWPYHPWSAWNNVQVEDAVTQAATQAIPVGSHWDAWVRKVAEHTCKFGNVTVEDGNEIGLKPGYQPTWTASVADVYRDECAKRSYLLDGQPHRPLLGTNSGSSTTASLVQVDYSQWHQKSALVPSQCAGKPCGVNEYNPQPAFEPLELKNQVCVAEQLGTWFSYWRHGQDAQAMSTSLSLIQQGCVE